MMRSVLRARPAVGLLVGLLAASLSAAAPAGAQPADPPRASFAVTDTPLGRALEQAAAAASISLVYDATLVRGHRTSCTVEEAPPEPLLRCLLDGLPIDYVRASSGTYVLREAVRRPPATGALQGRVRSAADRPLPHAHVRFPDAETGAVADSTGRFRLSDLPAGTYPIVVSRIGYASRRTAVEVAADSTTRAVIVLEPRPVRVDSVLVGANNARPGGATVRRVPAAELLRPPTGRPPGAVSAAQSLLGVTASAPYSDLHIQGGDSGEHALTLDGVPVRNPSSAGRLIGAFSPLALGAMTARKAGFGVLHGSRLSGTVAVDHDLSARGARYGSVRADTRSAGARLRTGTRVGNAPLTVLGAGRVSLWGVVRDPYLQEVVDRWSVLDPLLAEAQLPADSSLAGRQLQRAADPSVRFYDLHGAARLRLAPTRSLYASVYHGHSRIGADLALGAGGGGEPPDPGGAPSAGTKGALPTTDTYEWSNTAARVRYRHSLTRQSVLTLEGALSRYRSRARVDLPPASASASAIQRYLRASAAERAGRNAVDEAAATARLDASLADRADAVLTAGLTHQRSRFDVSNAFLPPVSGDRQVLRATGAARTTVRVAPRTDVEVGTRLTALPSRPDVYLEPRGALRHRLPLGSLGTATARVSGGLYRQFTPQFDLSRDGATAVVPTTHVWLPVSASTAPPRTYHLAARFSWSPAPAWDVTLEGYRKWQPHLLAVDYPALLGRPADAPVPDAVLTGSARGRALGAGAEIAYAGRAAEGSVRYSATRSRRTFPDRFGGRLTPVPWSEPHRLTAETRVPLGGGVSAEARGEAIWGRPWGYRRAYYAYLAPGRPSTRPGPRGPDAPDFSRPGDHVLPPLCRLDLGLRAERQWGGVDVTARAGVGNVLGRTNVANWSLAPAEGLAAGASAVEAPIEATERFARPLPGRHLTVSLRLSY
jgi:hypothetical protein